MDLSQPPEPINWKQKDKSNHDLVWEQDTLHIWLGNKLPSYLWKDAGWSSDLKKEGINWQQFLKVLSLHKKHLIQWHRNRISWKQLLHEIEETLNDPLFRIFIKSKNQRV